MTDKKNKPWYIARRGELLVEQFLLDLGAEYVSPLGAPDLGIDYIAFFLEDGRSPRAIGIEAKSTQQQTDGRYPVPSDLLRRFEDSNLPILFVVADVKRNEIFFEWVKKGSFTATARPASKNTTMVLRRATPEEREILVHEIFAQHPQAA